MYDEAVHPPADDFGTLEENRALCLPMDLSSRNRRPGGLEAQSRAFNSGADIATHTNCWSLSAPEFRHEGENFCVCFDFGRFFPLLRGCPKSTFNRYCCFKRSQITKIS